MTSLEADMARAILEKLAAGIWLLGKGSRMKPVPLGLARVVAGL